MVLFLIYESAIGLSLFEVKEVDETNAKVGQIQASIKKFDTFSSMVKLKAFEGFDASTALESCRELGGGNMTELL